MTPAGRSIACLAVLRTRNSHDFLRPISERQFIRAPSGRTGQDHGDGHIVDSHISGPWLGNMPAQRLPLCRLLHFPVKVFRSSRSTPAAGLICSFIVRLASFLYGRHPSVPNSLSACRDYKGRTCSRLTHLLAVSRPCPERSYSNHDHFTVGSGMRTGASVKSH